MYNGLAIAVLNSSLPDVQQMTASAFLGSSTTLRCGQRDTFSLLKLAI